MDRPGSPRTRPGRCPALLAGILIVLASRSLPAGATSQTFVRGDADPNGVHEITDAIAMLNFGFLGLDPPPCLDAVDADDNGEINITDPIYLLNYLFLGGPAPPEPYPVCGPDPTDDALSCKSYEPCGSEPGSEFKRLASMYGTIRTLAGRGEFGTNGLNAWIGDFEGGPAAEAELSRPHNAMGDLAGNVYIADKDAHAIRKVLPDGTIHTVAGTNEPGDDGDAPGPGTERRLNAPNGLWGRSDGTVYILDTGNGKVRRLDPSGTMATLFTVEAGIPVGRGLWVSAKEDLAFVSAGSAVLRWTPSAGVEEFSTGYVQLGNLTVDPEGNLVVTDRGGHRVYRVDASGERTPIAGNGFRTGGGDGYLALETGLDEVRGVFFHPLGGYFLGTHEGSQVWYVDTKGVIHLFVDGREGAHGGDGQPFDSPGYKVSEVRNVTVDPAGNVLITENDLGFIRIVERIETPGED